MAIDLEKNHGVFIHEGVFNELQDQVTDIDNRVKRNTDELQEHSQKIAENIENIRANKNELIKHEGEIAENKQAIDETKQHLDEVQADLEQKIANEHAFTEQEIAGVRTELTKAKNELNERIDREVNDLNATIDSTKQALQSSIDALTATEQQDKAELEDKIKANQDSIDALGTRVKALEDFKTEINDKVNTNTTDINQLKTQTATLAGDAQRLSTQLDTTNQQLSTLSSLVDQTRDDLESAKTELDDKIAAIVDHDTYVTAAEVHGNDLVLVQNDPSKIVTIGLNKLAVTPSIHVTFETDTDTFSVWSGEGQDQKLLTFFTVPFSVTKFNYDENAGKLQIEQANKANHEGDRKLDYEIDLKTIILDLINQNTVDVTGYEFNPDTRLLTTYISDGSHLDVSLDTADTVNKFAYDKQTGKLTLGLGMENDAASRVSFDVNLGDEFVTKQQMYDGVAQEQNSFETQYVPLNILNLTQEQQPDIVFQSRKGSIISNVGDIFIKFKHEGEPVDTYQNEINAVRDLLNGDGSHDWQVGILRGTGIKYVGKFKVDTPFVVNKLLPGEEIVLYDGTLTTALGMASQSFDGGVFFNKDYYVYALSQFKFDPDYNYPGVDGDNGEFKLLYSPFKYQSQFKLVELDSSDDTKQIFEYNTK